MLLDHYTIIAKGLYGVETAELGSPPEKVEDALNINDIIAWVDCSEGNDDPNVRFVVVSKVNSRMSTVRFLDQLDVQTFIKNLLIPNLHLYRINGEPNLRTYVDLLDWCVSDFDPLDPETHTKSQALSACRYQFAGIPLSTTAF